MFEAKSNLRDGFVTAWYTNPKTGKVEKHRMTSMNFIEATEARWIGDGSNNVEKAVNPEAHLWSMEQPTEPVDIIDKTTAPFEALLQATTGSNPPPAIETRSPDPLKRTPRRRAA